MALNHIFILKSSTSCFSGTDDYKVRANQAALFFSSKYSREHFEFIAENVIMLSNELFNQALYTVHLLIKEGRLLPFRMYSYVISTNSVQAPMERYVTVTTTI